jgi:hypothetical protein
MDMLPMLALVGIAWVVRISDLGRIEFTLLRFRMLPLSRRLLTPSLVLACVWH